MGSDFQDEGRRWHPVHWELPPFLVFWLLECAKSWEEFDGKELSSMLPDIHLCALPAGDGGREGGSLRKREEEGGRGTLKPRCRVKDK